MKPYHIQSSFHRAWVDLESIQQIYDVQVLPDTHWGNEWIAPALFSIQFAFQNATLTIHTFAGVDYGERDLVEKGKQFEKVRAEIKELQRAHDALVEAWKSTSI